MGRIRSWWLHYLPGRFSDGSRYDMESLSEDLQADYFGEDGTWWTCNKDARVGDYALLYIKSPISAISAIMRINSDPQKASTVDFEEPIYGDWYATVTFLHTIEAPLTFHQMRDDEKLRLAWGLVRCQMQSPEQSPAIERKILNLLSDRIPTLAEFLGEEKEERKLEEEKSTEQWGVFTSAGKLFGRSRTKSDAQKQKTSDSDIVMQIRPGSEFYKE